MYVRTSVNKYVFSHVNTYVFFHVNTYVFNHVNTYVLHMYVRTSVKHMCTTYVCAH